MAESTLQDRLRDHAKSFDGLLSLIPADLYYGKGDTSDQWNKKKQTKEEAAAARRAKLDPDSLRNAKDVMDERAKKRKLEELEESNPEISKTPEQEQNAEESNNKAKKQKVNGGESSSSAAGKISQELSEDAQAAKKAKAEAKAEHKKQKLERKKERKAEKQNAKKERDSEARPQQQSEKTDENPTGDLFSADDSNHPNHMSGGDDVESDKDLQNIDIEGIVEKDAPQSPPSPRSTPASPVFDTVNGASANTSTSSVIPPATAPKHIKLPTDPELLKQRLAARIEALRAARKADGLNGAPARTRQELMEARRKKEEQRRAHKKELRRKAKEEEEARREEALSSARDSPMSPAIHNAAENFLFGRVAFPDGENLSNDLSSSLAAPKSKGPSDPATALQASEKKRLRIAGLDDEKRADIEEKDLWLNAKKRAHGEKVRDDVSLLKKTLKRKEKAKKKSEKEWNARKEGVAKGQAMRQKKREENLRKRRDEKGSKGKGKGKSSGGKKSKPKGRPGF